MANSSGPFQDTFSLHDFYTSSLNAEEIINFLRSSDSDYLVGVDSYLPSAFPVGHAMWSQSWRPLALLESSIAAFKPDSFGFALLQHLGAMSLPGVSPVHSRLPFFRFPFDYPCSFPDWVMRRMQQTHDCLHVLLGLGVSQQDEMVLQAFYYSQGCQPMGMLYLMQEICSSFSTLRVDPCVHRHISRIIEVLRVGLHSQPDLISFPYEDHLLVSLDELRLRLGIDLSELNSI